MVDSTGKKFKEAGVAQFSQKVSLLSGDLFFLAAFFLAGGFLIAKIRRGGWGRVSYWRQTT